MNRARACPGLQDACRGGCRGRGEYAPLALPVWRVWLLAACCAAVHGDDAARPFTIGGAQLTGSLRARVEDWAWFRSPPAGESYAYGAAILRLNLGQSSKRWEWQVDGGFPLYLGLPAGAVAPDPQGPLGYGGDYFAVNGQRNIATAVLRQAFLGVKSGGLRFRAGRFEFADGSEAVPPDPLVAALKRERVRQRLIAVFNYALRSLDGAQISYDRGPSNFFAMGARVVEGSFQVRAFREIDADLYYGAYTRALRAPRFAGEIRLFGLHYHDGRHPPKSDNRPSEALQADRQPVRLTTTGASFISVADAGPGTVDFVLWGAGQFGRWGSLRHAALEIAAEAGYRLRVPREPWLRIGYVRSSGDGHPLDGRHGTFFRVLSTPRAYARFPAYILMNAEDRFVQFRMAPVRGLTLGPEVHVVRLSNARDLWYDGGGAFQEQSFGYLSRPNGGRRKIGTAVDVSADYTLTRHTSVALYAGFLRGGAVPAFAFPAAGRKPSPYLLSIEIVRRF